MEQARRHSPQRQGGEVVDFDTLMLRAWTPRERADLLSEAQLIARVFAPEGGREALTQLAMGLSRGERDGEMDRHHARRLAAALKHLARAA